MSVLTEDSNNVVPSHGAGGPPNRPLPPTPDDDDQQAGDRTLIMKRVSLNRIHECCCCLSVNNALCVYMYTREIDFCLNLVFFLSMCYAKGSDSNFLVFLRKKK